MQEDVAIFEKLSSVVDKTEERDESFKPSLKDHLQSLEIEFQQYLPELKKEKAALIRNPFSTSLVAADILD